MNKKIVARDLMKEDCLMLAPETPTGDAINLLQKKDVQRAFIVDHDGKLLGIFSDHDAIVAFLKDTYYESQSSIVKDFIKGKLQFLDPNDDLMILLEKFLEPHKSILPVVKQEILVGYVMRKSLLKALNQEWSQKDRIARIGQDAMVGRWAKHVHPLKGTALPEGFDDYLLKKD